MMKGMFRYIPLLLAALLTLGQHRAFAAPFVPKRDPQCVAVSPSGTIVATACSGMSDDTFPPRPHPDVRKCGVVSVWDVESGKRLWRAETFGDITKLAFSIDGSLLAASRIYSTSDGLALNEVRLWDVTSGKAVKVLDRCQAFDFSPDGRALAVLSRTRCVVYALNDWTKETQVKPLGGSLAVAFAGDANLLCGIVKTEEQYAIRLCDITKGTVTSEARRLDDPFYALSASADGATLASGHDGGNVVLWNLPSLEVRTRLQTGVKGQVLPLISPDGRYLAGGCQENGDVIIWDARTAQELHRYTFEKGALRTYFQRGEKDLVRPERNPTRFAFLPDSSSIMAGCYGGIIRAVDGGQELKRFGD
jgi:WD40 repeat protein